MLKRTKRLPRTIPDNLPTTNNVFQATINILLINVVILVRPPRRQNEGVPLRHSDLVNFKF